MPGYYEFEVSLRDVTPRIWRRFLLPVKATTFHDLHEAIQDACGWQNYHLFQFLEPDKADPIAGIPGDDDSATYGFRMPDARTIQMRSFFSETESCLYEYDFGDGWLHEVTVLRQADLRESLKRRLVAGERSFPPEDCGGIGGYERILQTLATGEDPWGEDAEELKEWLGDWEPEGFNLEDARVAFDRNPRSRGKKASRSRSKRR